MNYLRTLFGLLAIGSFSAQERPAEEFLFTSPRSVKIMSVAKFDKMLLSQQELSRLSQEDKLPDTYFIHIDTNGNTLLSLVRFMQSGRQKPVMIAYRQEKKVTLIEVLDSKEIIADITPFYDTDISGDGVKEVFIYFTKHYSHAHDYGSSQGTTRQLEVWDPVTRQMLLAEDLGSSGSGWSMCTGKTTRYSALKEYNFFTGGFSISEKIYRSEEHKQEVNTEKKGPAYIYTSKGFMLDRSKDCCTLHIKNTDDKKELKREYLRLRQENKNNPSCCISVPGGLYECMRIMASRMGPGIDSKSITELFGKPDLELDHFPQELQSLAANPGFQKKIQLWNYQLKPDFYLYFIVKENKVLDMSWYYPPAN